MTKHKVVIVDDEPAIRRLLKSALDRDGYKVVEAGTGREPFDTGGAGKAPPGAAPAPDRERRRISPRSHTPLFARMKGEHHRAYYPTPNQRDSRRSLPCVNSYLMLG
jgi:hypothetical protein